ncbi:MAG TPA: O-acetyl-ADP-ribose deacetylase [Cyanothece sp. UBA12306]|nr:O-acetyl-ADP-ribose deacetylase [Cyanothece sp. UBA12306]
MNTVNGTSKKIVAIQGDITQQAVDAIVNAANKSLLGGSGVDGAIHRAAGPELLAQCRLLNGCETGDAKITKGYNLLAKWVIHTVGLIWRDGNHGEKKLLASCYVRSLEIAAEKGLKTIAFPAISTGVYGFPVELATPIAIRTVKEFLQKNSSIQQVIFVCFNDQLFEIYRQLLPQILSESN